jgi:hypothetical protein
LALLAGTLLLGLIVGAVTSTVYVGDIKTKVAEHGVQLGNIEKNADRVEKNLGERITSELGALEKRVVEAIDRLRPKR